MHRPNKASGGGVTVAYYDTHHKTRDDWQIKHNLYHMRVTEEMNPDGDNYAGSNATTYKLTQQDKMETNVQCKNIWTFRQKLNFANVVVRGPCKNCHRTLHFVSCSDCQTHLIKCIHFLPHAWQGAPKRKPCVVISKFSSRGLLFSATLHQRTLFSTHTLVSTWFVQNVRVLRAPARDSTSGQ